MKLHEAIKQLIGQFGNEVVTEVRLANLLADLNGYEEYPAMKPVFKDIQKEGFGQKLYDYFCKNTDGILNEIPALIQQCADKTGYKENLISYGFDSILFGLGVVKTINEPLSKGYDPKAKDGDILDTMDEQLASLQRQYLDLLDRLATQPKDILHDAPAYYSAEAQNKLYTIEAKIGALLQESNKTDEFDWCCKKKNAKLSDFKKAKTEAVIKKLTSLYNPYIERLYFLSSQVKQYTYNTTEFSSDDTMLILQKESDEILSLQNQMDIIDSNWLSRTANRFMEIYRKRQYASSIILKDLQSKYSEILHDGLVYPQKDTQTLSLHYEDCCMTCLSSIESCIKFICLNAGVAYNDWCETTLKDFLAQQNMEFVKKRIEDLKSEYLELLANLITIPRKLFIKVSGYYDEKSISALSKVESQIKKAYVDSNTTYDNWCEKTKADYLAKHHVEANNIIAQVIGKIGIPAAMLIGVSATGVSYTSSTDAIQRFEQTISQGEQKEANNKYGDALQLFSDAKVNYDGSFRSGHYEDIANEHIKTSIDKAVSECNRLIENGELTNANSILKSLPTKVIAENTENAEKVKTVQSLLTKAVDEGLDNLINNISQNKGHLDTSTKKQLNELLSINPNDYWLNFIKNKEQ